MKSKKKQKRTIKNFLKQSKKLIRLILKQQKIGKKRDIVETIDDVVNGEEPLKQDTEDFLFIYDDDDFDEIIPEDKKNYFG